MRKTDAVKRLLAAADQLWTDAAEGGCGKTAVVTGAYIRELALAVCDVHGYSEGHDMRKYAELWPSEDGE